MQPILAVARVAPARGLATNILAQPLERLPLADLRREVRRLGLSQSGKRATLITRIQQAGKRADDATGRGLATTATAPHKPSRSTLDVRLPDLSPPPDMEGPHIPFLPDFWDSAGVRARDAIHRNPGADSPLPKVLVVAGTEASSLSLNISQDLEVDEIHVARDTSADKTGFWGDIAADLGLPRSSDISAAITHARDVVLSRVQGAWAQERTEYRASTDSRPLDPDEARGLWILLGILGGSWLAGDFFGPAKKKV